MVLGDEVLRDPSARVPDGAPLVVDGEALADAEPPPLLALFHKPIGVLSTVGDDHGRASLESAARELLDLGLHPVGRLDVDTDGLLPFSSDGALTQRLLHPRRAIPRTYVARVEGVPGEGLKDQLAAGVATSDGVFRGEVVDLVGDRVTLRVTEGKHRMVRRMLANAGFPVLELRRLAYGPLLLGELAAGEWRPVTAGELAACGLELAQVDPSHR